ncbi:inositol polyphosphate 5-phosphatase K-like isoform X2 [Entelurus aequoreus]|uniref:inositol polyphosphate 5-phosphatase K-like isoform X2 n=1 Tax=Entelurus aequoreus TaxID=161455 RepID=UPI002B1D1895|nr:inositol polyphosphate 5-phosphatase K-like isoform X2 [Entelurus aequoreus]
MDFLMGGPRLRSDSASSGASSRGSRSKMLLRQRLTQLLTRIDDMSSDDEASEEVSRTLDEAFQLCGRFSPTDAFRLHMVTWNVATAEPPDDVTSLLQLDVQPPTDLYVIGLQEVCATPVRFISDLMADDSWSHVFMDTLAPRGFVKVASMRMQGLLLLVFAKQAHIPYIRDIQTTFTRTGIFGYWGNKGAVSVRCSFYGHKVCFLNCHLAAHMNYALQRVDEFEHILETQDFDVADTPRVLDHKLVFWFGDLNFRIADHGLHFLRSSINGGRVNLLWDKDQLISMKKKEAFLQEFEEGPLNFKPTYKFGRNSDAYDISAPKSWWAFKVSNVALPLTMYRPRPLQRCSTTLLFLLTSLTWALLSVRLGGWHRELDPPSGKKRKPAWTDRILWRIKPKNVPLDGDDDDDKASASTEDDLDEYPLVVSQDKYTSDMSYGVSDHKPVMASFSLELRKHFDTALVHVSPEGVWSADHDALLNYTVQEDFMSSTWDWIGLYKVGFKSASDYETFVWVREDELPETDEIIQVSVDKDDIPLLGGHFVLGYYSTNMQSIIGLSANFQILESKRAVMEGLVPENANGLTK